MKLLINNILQKRQDLGKEMLRPPLSPTASKVKSCISTTVNTVSCWVLLERMSSGTCGEVQLDYCMPLYPWQFYSALVYSEDFITVTLDSHTHVRMHARTHTRTHTHTQRERERPSTCIRVHIYIQSFL